jgi:hypothetical protein
MEVNGSGAVSISLVDLDRGTTLRCYHLSSALRPKKRNAWRIAIEGSRTYRH